MFHACLKSATYTLGVLPLIDLTRVLSPFTSRLFTLIGTISHLCSTSINLDHLYRQHTPHTQSLSCVIYSPSSHKLYLLRMRQAFLVAFSTDIFMDDLQQPTHKWRNYQKEN